MNVPRARIPSAGVGGGSPGGGWGGRGVVGIPLVENKEIIGNHGKFRFFLIGFCIFGKLLINYWFKLVNRYVRIIINIILC